MQLLSNAEISQVSGGHQVTKEEAFKSMEHYSFSFALVGGAVSGIYGMCTNANVSTMVGTTMTIAGSFTNVFWIGLGISWALGATVGLGVAIYNAEYAGQN